MAEALISAVLQQLATIIDREVQQEVKLVVGVEKEVQKLTSNLQAIQAVLDDAVKRQVKEVTVRGWLEKLKDTSYDIEDLLDEWSIGILELQVKGVGNSPCPKGKACYFIPFPCLCLSRIVQRHNIALKIKELNEKIDVIANEKDRYNFTPNMSTEEPERQTTVSLVDVSEMRGRDEEKKNVVSKLLSESSEEERGLHIISIVGMGGIGKTTLAQLAYNDHKVRAHFEIRVWVCVSDPFDEIRVAKAILEALAHDAPNLVELETILQQIDKSVEGKKFLLVLDDVWTEDYKKWEQLKQSLKSGAPGSRILVTTRKERVANMMGVTYMFPLGTLSDEECWSLFSQVAFFGKGSEDCEKLKGLGRKIANKCKGLPLAAKVLGSLMRFKKTKQEWQNVLDSEVWELEEAERGLFPPLFLSYYDLPPAMKRCFSYCAVFPKDYPINKDELVELWMAQGYLSSKPSTEMEITGQEYFESLATRSFFQDFEKNVDGSIVRCKMHDIVHDFALFLTKNECFIMEIDGVGAGMDSSSRKTRHLSLMHAADATVPISIYNSKNLRTLLIQSLKIYSGLFSHLKCLRALDLSECFVGIVPRDIGKLIHLRYLNLSSNKGLKELPETVCDLYNLQTLNLNWCSGLQKLPQRIGELINLRHLQINETESLVVLPKGIGRLSTLRTLSKFVVSDRGDACKIKDLKNLNLLQGHVTVNGLGNVANGFEAGKAQLKNKKQLLSLGLHFSAAEGGVWRTMDSDVLEALEPPSDLEFLDIRYCGGTTVFPNWMMLLTKLRKLQLRYCRNWGSLPPFGKLLSLESLEMWGMDGLKSVGVEFLGIGKDDNGKKTGRPQKDNEPIIAFPKLKELRFMGATEWEEWDGIRTRRKGDEEETIMIMPCLRYLELWHCPKLKALPDGLLQATTIQELRITLCPILDERCQMGTGEDWPKISHIPNIYIHFDYVQTNGREYMLLQGI